MMKIVVNLKLKRRVKHTSAKHPRHSPERNGQARIVGGCPVCSQMFSLCRAKRSVEPPCALSSTRQPASRKKGNASPQLQPKPKRNLSLHTLR